MDLLYELAYILSLHPPASLGQLLPSKSKMRLLYDAILKNKSLTDQEAAALIYGSSEKDKKYLMLKRSLIQKLFELVLISEYVDSQQENFVAVRFACERELTIAEKLLLQNVYHNAEKIIQKTIKTAQKYYLLDVQLACLQKLRTIYSLKGFPNETRQFNQEILVLNQHHQYLLAAQGMWQVLQSNVKFMVARSEAMAEESSSYAVQIHHYFEQTQNPFLVLYYLRIKMVESFHRGETAAIWGYFKKLVDLIEHNLFLKTDSLLLEFNRDLGRYYLLRGKRKYAEKHLKKSLKLADYRAFNKFELMADYFNVHLKSEKYEEAGKVLEEVYKLPQFELLDPLDRAAWSLREAYLFIAFSFSEKSTLFKQFTPHFKERISVSWLNASCQANAKDKQGYNMLFMVARLLLMHLRGEEDLSAEANNMMVYYQRHLKELGDLKTRCFFKRITKAAKENFQAGSLQKQEKNYDQDLAMLPISDVYEPCEWIPYPVFWKLLYWQR